MGEMTDVGYMLEATWRWWSGEGARRIEENTGKGMMRVRLHAQTRHGTDIAGAVLHSHGAWTRTTRDARSESQHLTSKQYPVAGHFAELRRGCS